MKHTWIVLAFLAVLVSFATAGINSELEKKMARAEDGQIFPIIVAFKERFDATTIAQKHGVKGDEYSTRTQTVQLMKNEAERAHFSIQALCSQRKDVKDFSSFWIANMVSMKASVSTIREIASLPEVQEVVLDEEQVMIDYAPGVPTRDAWGLGKIESKKVNEKYKGKGILVAVIDTGINYNHDDLKGRVLKGKDFVNNDDDGLDDQGHGSHCAGSIGGTTYGVAPEVTLLAVKVLSSSGSGSWEGVAKGVQYVADYKDNGKTVDIASMSLGGRPPCQQVLKDAFTNGLKLGVRFAIAAGNSGPSAKTIGTPGDLEDIISVGATDINDGIASFSSRGPVSWNGPEYIKPDVSAPGVNITSCWKGASNASNTISGTSMATPHVAGLMALMLEARPGLPNQAMKTVLEKTSKDLGTAGKDNNFGSGRIQAPQATSASLSYGERVEITQEVPFKINADGTINVKVTKENPLWETDVKVWIKILSPAGTYSGKFEIVKSGKPTQTGTITNLSDNKEFFVGKYKVYDGENTLVLNATYTGNTAATEGVIWVKGETVW